MYSDGHSWNWATSLFLCVLPRACDDALSTHHMVEEGYSVEIYIPHKVEDLGYGCRMDALSSFTLFIGHTRVPSGFFLSMSVCMCLCVCVCVCLFRSV